MDKDLQQCSEQIIDIISLVRLFFKDNVAKCSLWFTTENEGLGGVKPLDLIHLRHTSKLHAYLTKGTLDI